MSDQTEAARLSVYVTISGGDSLDGPWRLIHAATYGVPHALELVIEDDDGKVLHRVALDKGEVQREISNNAD